MLPLSNIMFIIFIGRTFLHKNSAQWNKKVMTLRINQIFSGTNIEFVRIKSVETENKQLKIELKNNQNLQFDLSHIRENDIQKLKNIIKQNI